MSSGHRILISGMLSMQNITTLPEKTCGSEFLRMERYTSVRGAHRVFVHYLSEHVFFVKGYTCTLSKLVLNFLEGSYYRFEGRWQSLFVSTVALTT